VEARKTNLKRGKIFAGVRLRKVMAVDKSIINAIISAVESSPENMTLRLHLVSLLLEDGQNAEALKHCSFILNEHPAHLEALKYAAQAADSLGETRRAEGYRKLYAALGGETVKAEPLKKPETNETSQFSGRSDEWSEIILDEETERIPLKEAVDDFIDDDDSSMWETERPDVTLLDVAGMETVKRRLNLAFLAPLKNPEMMKMYGKSLRGGLLLYGPPGCGKTFIARATAGELGAKFISVGLADVLDMWIGSSEKNIHEIFERARRNAPCVLFFDEIDALGRKRSLTRNSSHGTINQLLSELDGVNQQNEGVFVLAATNHPWDVDTALRRPGRLDRTLLVLPPDIHAREAILEMNLRSRPVDGSVDLKFVAQKTNEFSGADLTHIVESSAEIAMEESLTSGRVRPINQNDFKRALKEIKASTRPWFEVARNYAQFANEGGMYDELLEYLRQQRML
jgi:SpoVK/Ycf46/Vps4 family AAA+-type ATPase